MNIEIANRLVKLRKEKGYSQEDLAEKLGISRQAVSKWERAEASPDTDNLICLAKLYGVSLDELLNTDESVEDIVEEQVKASEQEETVKQCSGKREEVHIGKHGIHIVDKDGSEVHVSKDGVVISERSGTKKHFNKSDISIQRPSKYRLIESIISGSYAILVCIVYLLLGFFVPGAWGKAWVLFVTIGFVPSLFVALRKRKFCIFGYPVFVASIFLFIGACFSIWHPTWVVFLTIPVYYITFGPIDKYLEDKRLQNMKKTSFVEGEQEEKNEN